MSVLYLHFESGEREARVQKLAKSGAQILVSEPHWPGFFEIAKKEKPYAIAIDFSYAPSHALETADYIAKAKETREVSLYILNVPPDRLDLVKKRLSRASIVTEQELSERLARAEQEARERARQKKQASAQARKVAQANRTASQRAPAATASRAKPAPRVAKPGTKKPPRKPARKKPAHTKKKAAKKKVSRIPKKK